MGNQSDFYRNLAANVRLVRTTGTLQAMARMGELQQQLLIALEMEFQRVKCEDMNG
jgi:hypothetical protein